MLAFILVHAVVVRLNDDAAAEGAGAGAAPACCPGPASRETAAVKGSLQIAAAQSAF